MIEFYIFEHYNINIKKRGVKMGFQENLRYYREKANLTPTEMAKYLNVAYNTYVGYEVRGREPKYAALCKIADLLNVSTDELLGRKNNILGMSDDEQLKQTINDLLEPMNKEYKSEFKIIKFNADNVILSNLKAEIKTEIIIKKDELINFINYLKKQSKMNEGYLIYDRIISYETIELARFLRKNYDNGSINRKTYDKIYDDIMVRSDFDNLDIYPIRKVYKINPRLKDFNVLFELVLPRDNK